MSKQILQKMIGDLQTKKFRDGEAKGLMTAVQTELMKTLEPAFTKLGELLVEQMATQFEKLATDIMKKTSPDMTETNKLLTEMKDKLNEPCDIKLSLK